MKIAILQLPTLQIKDKKLDQYLEKIKSQKVSVVALGEYVLNDFFRHFSLKNKKEICKTSSAWLKHLKALSKKYNLCFVAPLIVDDEILEIEKFKKAQDKGRKRSSLRESKKCKIFKTIAILKDGGVKFYIQQRLISYEHWNEYAFFDNKLLGAKNKIISAKKLSNALQIFEINGAKCAALFGFEIHFDEFWLELKKLGVDIVFLSTASCFDSTLRWRMIAQTRAFLNSICLVRVNKIGEEKIATPGFEGAIPWNFYGDSFISNSQGEIFDSLNQKEGMIIQEVDISLIRANRKEWGF